MSSGSRNPLLPRHLLLLPVALALLLLPAAIRASTNEDCLGCHSDSSLTMEGKGARKGHIVSLHVDAGILAGSPHKDLACVDCHQKFDAANVPHKAKITPVNCLDCHADAPSAHAFHSKMSGATGTDGEPGTSCKQCHGTHDVKGLSSAGSPFQDARLVEFCGKCHQPLAEQFARSEHGKAMAAGVVGAPTCLSCHENPITRARGETTGGGSAALKITQEKICLSCHLDNADVRARMGPSAGFIAAFEKSVHGRALQRGNGDAATCIDCHGSHEMRRGNDPDARVSRTRIPETCSKCHADIAKQYAESVHAAAVRRGSTEAPVCTDCHGEHNILLHTDPNSPVAARNVSAQVCSPCHSSVKMSQKYGIASDRFKTFSDSYHGLAERGGSLEAANCSSCHGAHAIKPSSDPGSMVNKANLATTCGQCHPGANARFAVGSVHVTGTARADPILYWIATIYLVLIVMTIGGMVAHNLLDFLRKASHQLQVRRGAILETPASGEVYERMTLNERLQHGALFVSFTVLAITGFMLSYPDTWWVAGIRKLNGNVFELRSLLHRCAAVLMTAASLYHIGYITLTVRGRQLVRDLWPTLRDVRQALANVGYLLGLVREKPAFGRFGYVEKAEYWALVWGSIVMTVTGVIMWFDNIFIGLVTKLGWDIARTIHFWEAWLATLAIIVWHLYFVVFNPGAYPMNMSWLTGKLSEREMEEEHPAELEAIRESKAKAREIESQKKHPAA